MSQHEFVDKWSAAHLKESAAAQEHFVDLCRLIDHPTPAEDDPTGERFTFEAGVAKTGGGQGFADVWKRGCFAWEYKGKHADLSVAYQQLLKYRESLRNPPLLVVCDIDSIVVHTNFTNTVKRRVTITLDDLLTPDGMQHLRDIFYEPEAYRAPLTTEQVTEEAAREFARLAEHLRDPRAGGDEPDPSRIAHFLIRLLFCLFAEDIDLLDANLFTRLVDRGRRHPQAFTQQLRQLFGSMSTGGFFGEHYIRHFNGGLFDSDDVLPLDRHGLDILHRVAGLDWSSIEPSILGTLFERSLDPGKRAQLGAHYTSRDDILLIVEPVLMQPLRRSWDEARAEADAELEKREAQIETWQQRSDRTPAAIRTQILTIQTRSTARIQSLILGFLDEVRAIRVLDPACGSGNFLYVALRQLLDLEKHVISFAASAGIGGLFPQVTPAQLYGIELNEYAHELAQSTVWIGYIQWLHENGFGVPSEPILKPLDNIRQMDAILAWDEVGEPVEPEWPKAEIIIGNPPFLGSRKMRPNLGDEYCNRLQMVYSRRIDGLPDLVCYWFEKARSLIAKKEISRAGLLATQAIRGGANRQVLKQIKQTGDVFMAWSDREWVLDGAMVHVSLVGFDDGTELDIFLDGEPVKSINSDLTSGVDMSQAQSLKENGNLSFQGVVLRGPFNIDTELAHQMLEDVGNPNGRPNRDIIRSRRTGQDIVNVSSNEYVIDYGTDMPIENASQYVMPFEYLKKHVYPMRQAAKQAVAREIWWLHWNPRIQMRQALIGIGRYVATPRVAKHRIFVWLDEDILPDAQLVVFSRSDDYFFGMLHSRVHELWARRMGTQLREAESGFRYTSTTTFETFPFPWLPGQEPTDDASVHAIAAAAKELDEKRNAWLNPPGLSEKELKQRTLTKLYNARPTWLALLHDRLDAAVFAAYGWPDDLSDQQILERLLALNLARSQAE